MKGKKFDAHEKHFKEKEIKLNQEINRLRDSFIDFRNTNMCLHEDNRKLKKENLIIKEKYEQCLTYSNLSDDEIKEAIKSNTSMNNISTLFNMLPSI